MVTANAKLYKNITEMNTHMFWDIKLCSV